MIEISGLTKTFGEGQSAFTALDDVSVTIRSNEFFTLLGPSGCGKTTLLRTIAGFLDPTRGSLTLDGEDLLSKPPYQRPVNTVFQSYALFPHMTVAENIAFGLQMLNRRKAEITATVAEMLELVQMTALADRKTSQISGGQQQRVALARALAPRPKVLLLDEPLSALDFKLRKEMQLELKRLQHETGITFVFVTHDQEEALTMSDRIAVMNAGTIRQIGGPRDIYDHPAERFVADFIGDTNFLQAKILSTDGAQARVRLVSGGEIAAQTAADAPVLDDGASVTLAVRPEHAELCAPEGALLSGRLRDVVYFGTDTHYHVALDQNETFTLRRQNQPGQTQVWQTGDHVGLNIAPGIPQILKD
ncbi:ABC transporter ATP-binding protein [Tritonibacter horizontis]|uniref:Spermidine/putrescine import ATP-binding protein PotA n=1 Tax=Tritonibacter horizontis TaxID=1768241 RepID=A0A132BTA9_9RHOB|nr:ABC transporter ATP-binding protein [Tritonibacter horizontis]KUP91621.1 spermidine/putrescine import ATP-binding protein PotA [Tritonibacter horizontis]